MDTVIAKYLGISAGEFQLYCTFFNGACIGAALYFHLKTRALRRRQKHERLLHWERWESQHDAHLARLRKAKDDKPIRQ